MSNRQAHLQHLARTEHERFKRAEAESIDAYLACGHALIEAKDAAAHGEWLPWLKGAGIPERTAQRMMKLAKSRLKADTVSDLGGIASALRFCAWHKARQDRDNGRDEFLRFPESFRDRRAAAEWLGLLETTCREWGLESPDGEPVAAWFRRVDPAEFSTYDCDSFLECEERLASKDGKELRAHQWTTMHLDDAINIVRKKLPLRGTAVAQSVAELTAQRLMAHLFAVKEGFPHRCGPHWEVARATGKADPA